MSAYPRLPNRIQFVQEPAPSILLQCMGIESLRQDPMTANADWNRVLQRLHSHPNEARIMCGLSYPLNLALCNRVNPVPAVVIDSLIKYYPDAFMEEDIGNACRNKYTRGETMCALIHRSRELFTDERSEQVFKRWDLDWVACNNNIEVAKALIDNDNATNLHGVLDWKEIRPSNRAFWFSLMMESNSSAVSMENILRERVLQFFILQGNYTVVKLILDSYPELVAKPICTEHGKMQLPLHTALSNENPAEYRPWHNRYPIVRLLLEYGIKYEKACDSRGHGMCGGLWKKDPGKDALTYAIESALNYPWLDTERTKCLQLCLQYAQASIHDKYCDSVDLTLPILHSAIGVVPLDVFCCIIDKYGESLLVEVDRNGSTVLFHLIALAGERPVKGYAATRNILWLRKKAFERRNEEYFDRGLQERVALEFLYLKEIWYREKQMFQIQRSLSYFELVHESWASALSRLLDTADATRQRQQASKGSRINQCPHEVLSSGFDFCAAIGLYDEFMNARDIFNKSDHLREILWPLKRETQEYNAQLQDMENNINDIGIDLRIGQITSRQSQTLLDIIDEKSLEMDEIEERLIERTYFTCTCCILLMKTYSRISSIKNRKGTFPLHMAILKHSCCIEQVLSYFPEAFSAFDALSEFDPISRLFPFAAAAASPNVSLSFLYKLLLEHPRVIDQEVINRLNR